MSAGAALVSAYENLGGIYLADDRLIATDSASLEITGAFSIHWQGYVKSWPAGDALLIHTASGEAESENALYGLTAPDGVQVSIYWESGGGTDRRTDIKVSNIMPYGHWTLTRASCRILQP